MSEITPEQKAQMVMLSGLNYDQDEIAAEVGVSETSVNRYLNEFEERAKAAGDPRRVYWEIVLAGLFGDQFRTGAAAFLSNV